jgi:DNA-binding MarR family transcriptional regulator
VPKRPRPRDLATQAVLDAGRVLGAAAVLFHTVVAERQGLSATEEKALDLLDRFGPLTAGELAARSSLAPASVTGLLDRLERKGFIRRGADAEDRRRVRAHLVPERMHAFAPLYAGFVHGLHAVCARYTVEELELIARFLREAAACQQDAAAKLSAEPPAPG